jgi:ketopantoate reductase
MNLDILQESKIKWLIAGLGALGGIVALLVYLDQKKHNEVQKELFALDKEIKTLQLQKLKNGQA